MLGRLSFTALLLFVSASATLVGDDKAAPKPEAGKSATFEKFKALAGDWVGKKGADGPEMAVQYKVTSGGSAVVETIMPGTDHEMVTVIHPDGDNIILTHYCMIGNQPQMKAPGNVDGNKVAFTFVKATNLKSDKDLYMHDVTFTFVDKDTLKSEWTHFVDGKSSGVAVFELKRKK
jgi:hypothetical protein